MDEPFYNDFKIENNRVFIDEKKVKAVKNFEFASPNNGGNGATVVYFK